MSSFTKPLVVEKLEKMLWKVRSSFDYHLGSEDSDEVVSVPEGFITDFASVPRLFWIILPPDGQYTQAAVLHDYMYSDQYYKRAKCDRLFIEAMKVLKVPVVNRIIMYRAVRMFGWLAWKKKKNANKR